LEALRIYSGSGNRANEAKCLLNLGALKQQQGLQNAAIEYYSMAQKISAEVNDHETRASCYHNMAVIYDKKKDPQKALALNFEALKIRQMMDDNMETADSYLNLASLHIRSGDLKEAAFEIDTAMSIAAAFKYSAAIHSGLKLLSEYHAAAGDHRLAYDCLKRHEGMGDSLANISKGKLAAVDASEGVPENRMKNHWLLFSVLFLVIFIPYQTMSFRR
jgi:tetratricopeptide (TPR) repeat protein